VSGERHENIGYSISSDHARNDAPGRLIAELECKYLWWPPVGKEPHTEARIIAQAMNFGSYDDIRRMEQTLGPAQLAEVTDRHQPVQFTPTAPSSPDS
jgi:hypothetical protein